MTRRRYVVFGLVTAALSSLVAVTALLLGDLSLHARYERRSGYNAWGYRGPVVGAKRAGERRVVVLGGSTAFGYGVTWDHAFPAVLERKLNAALGPGARVSVVNLAWNNEGAYAFLPTLRDFRYLDYDVAVLYEGYNDLGGPGSNRQVFRHGSAVFRLTGYLPIFPLVFREKALALRHGDLAAAVRAERGDRVVFTPRAIDRLHASTLEMAAGIGAALERRIGRLSASAVAAGTAEPPARADCGPRWSEYCGFVEAAVGYLVARGRTAVVVTQPYITDDHVEQQRALRGLLAARFGGEVLMRHVNLGWAVDVADRALVPDGMHLGPAGNERIADGLMPAVLDLVRRP